MEPLPVFISSSGVWPLIPRRRKNRFWNGSHAPSLPFSMSVSLGWIMSLFQRWAPLSESSTHLTATVAKSFLPGVRSLLRICRCHPFARAIPPPCKDGIKKRRRTYWLHREQWSWGGQQREVSFFWLGRKRSLKMGNSRGKRKKSRWKTLKMTKWRKIQRRRL